jgi:hypothetical protein
MACSPETSDGRLDQRFRLANEPGSLGLSCRETGLALAGVPLLRMTAGGFTPRSADEIDVLMKGAYGRDVDVVALSPRLGVVAQALNRGDHGRAMVAALHLRLPELSWDSAVRIARADNALAKYNPNKPRDWHGRWTDGAESGGPATRPAHLYGGRLIPVADGPNLGVGSNVPPEAELVPGVEAIPDEAMRVPDGWDTPGHIVDGIAYPPSRNPTFSDGTPWPRVDADVVMSTLTPRRGKTPPSMVVYVPRDGVGPTLVGSTTTEDYEQPRGYDSVTLIGTPQTTYSRGAPTGHVGNSAAEGLRLAESNEFETIYFNRSFTLSTNGTVPSLLRPDVFAVARPEIESPYRYHPYETLSPGQSLRERQDEMPRDPSIRQLDGRSYKRLARLSPEWCRRLGVGPPCM